ncbi:MAG: transcription elongation factor [Acidobacteria bacterium]|nr:transcription elongation factor [Acidobacteriota bacterium]
MPEKKTVRRARKAKREGKAPSTQAGEFVREEIHHVREGKHGARSTKQAIAIGLSKARRSGVDVPAPKGPKSKTSRKKSATRKKSPKRSRATKAALKREGRSAASRKSLSRQGKSAARKRSKSNRSAAAKKAARTRKRRKS